MNVTIFIVSCSKHFLYLKYALRSIEKYATGFRNTVLMVPRPELDDLYSKTDVTHMRKAIDVVPFEEWPEKGMLHHEFLEMTAPQYCPLSDAILHFDSDMIFTQPVTPDDYVEDGKPVMVHATFKWLITQQANLDCWRIAVEEALGVKCEREMMRRPGLIHIPAVYEKAQQMIEERHREPLADYIRKQRNEFPQTFAEYPTLGWVAWLHFKDRYKWVEQGVDPFPAKKILQFWGHGPINGRQDMWIDDKLQNICPLDIVKSKGLE